MSTFYVYPNKDTFYEARTFLGNPASLDEAVMATGIDAFLHLLDDGEIVVEGKVYRLVEVEEGGEDT